MKPGARIIVKENVWATADTRWSMRLNRGILSRSLDSILHDQIQYSALYMYLTPCRPGWDMIDALPGTVL